MERGLLVWPLMFGKNLGAIKMIYLYQCDDSHEIEVFKANFEVAGSSSIQLTIMDGCFEHVPIMIKDPAGKMRGLFTLKTRIKIHFIGETKEQTSNGGIAGKLPNGKWTLEVLKPSLRVTGQIQIEIRQDRQMSQEADQLFEVLSQDVNSVSEGSQDWLKAELHAHSYYSDGRVNFEDIQEEIQEKALDVLAIMDHSVITTQFLTGPNVIIPGTEITLDNEVHYNVYGLKELIDYSHYFSEGKAKNQSLDEMFTDLKAQGSLLSINHPFAEGMSLQHDFNVTAFNFLEVINAPHSKDDFIDNEKAIRLFDFLWAQGHYLLGIGGSDAHKKNYHGRYPLGIPTNRIYCPQLSVNHVLEAMENGHVYVENQFPCQIQMIGSQQQEILPGMAYAGQMTIAAEGGEAVDWRLIMNGCCVAHQQGSHCQFEIDLLENSYVRLEAVKDGQPRLFVNPVYNKLNREIKVTSFAELIQQFEAQDNRGS